jgi:hypothetical protein
MDKVFFKFVIEYCCQLREHFEFEILSQARGKKISISTWHPIRRHSLVSTKKEKMSRSALSTRSHHPIVGAVLSIDILTSPSAVTIASASNYSPHIIYNVDETNLHPHCFNILCM